MAESLLIGGFPEFIYELGIRPLSGVVKNNCNVCSMNIMVPENFENYNYDGIICPGCASKLSAEMKEKDMPLECVNVLISKKVYSLRDIDNLELKMG